MTTYEQSRFERYLHENTAKVDFTSSLDFLSNLLYRHFGRHVYILIDDYDTPIISAYLAFKDRLKEVTEVRQLLFNMYDAALRSNHALKRGFLTGIVRIAKTDLFSDLNNMDEYTLLDKRFAAFYGFTEQEVDELLDQGTGRHRSSSDSGLVQWLYLWGGSHLQSLVYHVLPS